MMTEEQTMLVCESVQVRTITKRDVSRVYEEVSYQGHGQMFQLLRVRSINVHYVWSVRLRIFYCFWLPPGSPASNSCNGEWKDSDPYSCIAAIPPVQNSKFIP